MFKVSKIYEEHEWAWVKYRVYWQKYDQNKKNNVNLLCWLWTGCSDKYLEKQNF